MSMPRSIAAASSRTQRLTVNHVAMVNCRQHRTRKTASAAPAVRPMAAEWMKMPAKDARTTTMMQPCATSMRTERSGMGKACIQTGIRQQAFAAGRSRDRYRGRK